MERKKSIILILNLFFLVTLSAESMHQQRIYQAYISNQMNDWKKVIDELNKQQATNQQQALDLINYQYGYIGACIGSNKKEEAKNYLTLLEKEIEKLEKKYPELAEVYSYTSSLLGFKIALSPMRAPFYGPTSLTAAKKGLALNSNSKYTQVAYAYNLYYMPEMFGGSKKTALEHYLLAEQIWNATPEAQKRDWNYLSLLVNIAQAYDDLGNIQKAKLYYEKTLATEPNFKWVSNELYPNFLKKYNLKKTAI